MANYPFAVDIDLRQNQLLNAVFQKLTTAPQSPQEGQFYYDTALHTFRVYQLVDDTLQWTDGLNQGKIYSFGTGLSLNASTNEVTISPATAQALGGVKQGSNVSIADDGTISVSFDSLVSAVVLKSGTTDTIQVTKGGQTTDIKISKVDEATKATKDGDNNTISETYATKSEIEDFIELTDISATAPITYDNTTGVISAQYDSTPTADSEKLMKSKDIKTALDGKASTSHSHSISDVTDLSTSLGNKLDKNTAITGATKPVITYDSKGLVTGGRDLQASDIPDLSDTYLVDSDLNGYATESYVDGKFSKAYKPSGNTTFAQLSTVAPLSSASLGKVFNVTDDFTTTADFLEGAGKKMKAGSDVGVVLASENPDTYKYNVFGNFVDTSAFITSEDLPSSATTSAEGLVELATDNEAKTGSDSSRAITPSNLKAVIDSKKIAINNPALTQQSGVVTWEIDNTIGDADVVCIVKEIATGCEIICNITYSASKITIKMNSTSNISADTYKAVIKG